MRRRNFQKAADRKNANAKQEAGPLFADHVPETTAGEQYWHWRRNVALRAEDTGVGYCSAALRWLTVAQYKRDVAALLPPELYQRLLARTAAYPNAYPYSVDHHLSFWGSTYRHVLGTAGPFEWCPKEVKEFLSP